MSTRFRLAKVGFGSLFGVEGFGLEISKLGGSHGIPWGLSLYVCPNSNLSSAGPGNPKALKPIPTGKPICTHISVGHVSYQLYAPIPEPGIPVPIVVPWYLLGGSCFGISSLGNRRSILNILYFVSMQEVWVKQKSINPNTNGPLPCVSKLQLPDPPDSKTNSSRTQSHLP